MQIISSLKGTHFDPEVVDAFVALEGQFNRIREEKLKHEQKVLPSTGSCQPAFSRRGRVRIGCAALNGPLDGQRIHSRPLTSSAI